MGTFIPGGGEDNGGVGRSAGVVDISGFPVDDVLPGGRGIFPPALVSPSYFDLQNRPEFIGAWQAGQAFVAEAWTDVLGEVRGDLTAVEVRFVVDMTLGVIVEAAADLSGDSPWADEITNLALTFATTIHQG